MTLGGWDCLVWRPLPVPCSQLSIPALIATTLAYAFSEAPKASNTPPPVP